MYKSSRWHNLLCVFLSSPKKNTCSGSSTIPKLEILDTAGADQFHALHERYIKVRSCLIIITRDPNASPR